MQREGPTKIICVGRNYAEHASELGNAVPEKLLYFLKPPSSLLDNGGNVVLPAGVGRVDCEGELGVVIGKRTKNIGEQDAMQSVKGYVVCDDVTARDIQTAAKRKGEPWTVSKGYDTFFPATDMVPAASAIDIRSLGIETKVNGEIRQRGNTSDMIFSISSIISTVSTVMTLEDGDIIATGTPAGVSPIKAGDTVEVKIEGIGTLKHGVVSSL